jgi:hypothetical protein
MSDRSIFIRTLSRWRKLRGMPTVFQRIGRNRIRGEWEAALPKAHFQRVGSRGLATLGVMPFGIAGLPPPPPHPIVGLILDDGLSVRASSLRASSLRAFELSGISLLSTLQESRTPRVDRRRANMCRQFKHLPSPVGMTPPSYSVYGRML